MKTSRTIINAVVYIIIVTALFARMDWSLVHWKYQHPGERGWLDGNEGLYAAITTPAETIICAPCAALKPIAYNAFMSIEAGQQEQLDLWHAPIPYSGNPFLPDGGPHFWWSQGRYSGLPYRQIHLGAWFVYWAMPAAVWWIFFGSLFGGEIPFWIRWASKAAAGRKARSIQRMNPVPFERDVVSGSPR